MSLLLAMRLISAAVASLAIGAIAPISAIAQETEGCFMVDSSGRQISLGGLCQGGSVPASSNSVRRSNLSTLESDMAQAYANEYCSYRKANRPPTEAAEAASKRIALVGSADLNWEGIYEEAYRQIDRDCPES